MNSDEMLLEKTAPAAMPPGRAHVPNQKFIQEQFPEPVMPACPINKVLQGQKAIVTGVSSGIGRGIAMALGHAGADVLVNYSSRAEEAEKVADESVSQPRARSSGVFVQKTPPRTPANVAFLTVEDAPSLAP